MENFDHHRQELQEKGLTKLAGLIPPEDAQAAQDLILDLAREHDVYVADRWMTSPSRFGYPKPFRNALNGLGRSSLFPNLVGAPLTPLVERLIGEPVAPLSPGQQILFTLPGQNDWLIPHDVWHVDMPRYGDRSSPGLQAFTFLDDFEPRGGATLVIAGSHHLLNDCGELTSREFKRLLRKEEYFKSLFDPGRPVITELDQTKGWVGDVELEIVELTGRAGDVYLMDLHMLHTPAANCSDKARQMLTCRFPRSDIAARFGDTHLPR